MSYGPPLKLRIASTVDGLALGVVDDWPYPVPRVGELFTLGSMTGRVTDIAWIHRKPEDGGHVVEVVLGPDDE